LWASRKPVAQCQETGSIRNNAPSSASVSTYSSIRVSTHFPDALPQFVEPRLAAQFLGLGVEYDALQVVGADDPARRITWVLRSQR